LIGRLNQSEQQRENEKMTEQMTQSQVELTQAYGHIELLRRNSVEAAEEIEVSYR